MHTRRVGPAPQLPFEYPIDRRAARTYLMGWPCCNHGFAMEHVTVTERAARRISEILGPEGPGAALRVSVEGGGCSGFQYKFEIGRERAEDDIAVVRDGATVLIDQVSIGYLKGSEI